MCVPYFGILIWYYSVLCKRSMADMHARANTVHCWSVALWYALGSMCICISAAGQGTLGLHLYAVCCETNHLLQLHAERQGIALYAETCLIRPF